MKKNFALSVFLYFLMVVSAFGQTTPPNDNCANASLLTPASTCILTNSSSANATQSLSACVAGGVADDDVWFKFVATQANLTVKVNSSSNYDAVVEVFSGTCGNLNSLKCTDETGTAATELVHLNNLTVADTFYVRVYHYKIGTGSGTFSICVSPPSNDYCEGAVELPVNATCVTTNGTVAGATQSLPHCTAASGIVRDVWFSFVALSAVQEITVKGNGNFNAVAELFSGSCSGLASLHCEDITYQGEIETILYDQFITGQRYFVRVYDKHDNATNKTFTICVKEIISPPGANCAAAITIPAIPFNSGLQTTCGKGDTYRSYCNEPYSPGEDFVFKLNITNAPVRYTIKTTTHLYVYDNCPSAGGSCNIPGITGGSGSHPAERVVSFDQNGTYYLVADSYYGCGNFWISVEPAPPSPNNDLCVNAIALSPGNICTPINGTTVNATVSDASACPGNMQDVWYKFTAKTTSMQISATGNGHSVELLTGNCQSLSSIICRTASQGSFTRTDLVVGQQYFLRVFNGAGNFTICLREIPSAGAPPANDSCAGAIPITSISSTCQPITGTLANMTKSGPNCLNNNSPDAWYSFTATQANYEISLSNLSSSISLSFEVLTGNCSNPQSLRCASGSFAGYSSFARLTGLIPGNVYFVKIFANIASNSTNLVFELCIKETLLPPTGTTCQTAEQVISFPFNSGLRTNCGNGSNFKVNCNSSSGEGHLYKITVSNAPVSYNIHLANYGFNPSIPKVFSDCPESVTAGCIAGTNNIFHFPTNGSFYILAPGSSGCGSYELSITEVPPTPTNDNCSGAIPLTVNSTFVPTAGSSLNATQSAASCYNQTTPDDDVWYSFVATTPFQQIKVGGSPGYKAIMQLYRGTCSSLTTVACRDLPRNTATEKTLYADNLIVGDTYYVRVYHAEPGAGPTGQFTIGVIAATGRPAGAICTNAVPIMAIPFYSGQQTTCGKGDEISGASAGTPFANGEDMVYSMNITNAPVTYQFRLGGSGIQKTLWVQNGCSTPQLGSIFQLYSLGMIQTRNDSVAYGKITFPANGLYYVVVDSDAPVFCSDFTLNITPDNSVAPVNNICANALPIPVTTSCNYISKNILNAQPMDHNGGPNNATAGVWYKFVPVSSGLTSVSIKTSAGMAINASISSGPCDSLITVASGGGNTPGKTVNYALYNLKPGKEYFIHLYTYANQQGSGDLEICIFSLPALPNDNCSGAIPITASPYTAPVFTTGSSANAQPSMQACSGNGDDDVWYSFTATETRHKVVLQSQTGYDGVLEIFSGTCSNLVQSGCADRSTSGGTESLELDNLTVGQTYFIKVHHQGIGWGSGNFSLSVQTMPTPPANDNCDQAILLTAGTTCNPVSGTTQHTTESLAGCSGASAADVWYKFTALSPEHTITVQSIGDFDAVVEIFSGSCTGLNSMVCRDSSSTGGLEQAKAVGFTPGETYFIRVYDYQGQSQNGNFSICVRSTSSVAVLTGNPVGNTNTYCAETSFRLPFRALGTFNLGNDFVAELSNAAGNFANAIEIGRKSGTLTDTILVQLPVNLVSGTIYKLRVVATDPGYLGIESNTILTVNALPAKPIAANPPAYCLGEPIAALTATGTNIKWYSDSLLTNLTGTGTTFTPSAQLTASTTFYVTQTTNSCQSQPTPVTITIKPKPDASFAGLDSVYCISTQPVILQPTVAGGTFSGNYVANNSFIPAVPGLHTISYSVTQNGCTASYSKTVLVKAGPATFTGPDQTMCSGSTISVGGLPTMGYLYNWSPTAGLSNSNIANPDFTFTNATVVNDTILKQLTVTDSISGCSTSALVRIVVKGQAGISAGPAMALCQNAPTQPLTGIPVGGTWSGSHAITGSDFDPASAGPGVHKLVYTVTQNGCTKSDTLRITVNSNPVKPIISLSGNTLTANNSTGNYQWYLATGTSLTPVTGAISQSFTPSVPGIYTVVITESGCNSDTAAVVNIVLGTCEELALSQLQVYPNPATEIFNLKLNNSYHGAVQLQLFDLTGRLIQKQELRKTESQLQSSINVENLPSGLYLLRVQQGDKMVMQKLTIKR